MIVIGKDVIESYLADHTGHKGIKTARSQYNAWLDIVVRANWHTPEDVKASYPKASILKASRVVFNIKGQRLSVGRPRAVPSGSFGNSVLRDACRIRQDRRGDSVMD